MRKLFRGLAGLLSAGISSLLVLTLIVQASLPDDFTVAEDGEFYINSNLFITADKDESAFKTAVYNREGQAYSLNLSLFHTIPLKEVQVQVTPRKMVVPGGTPFGIKMFTKGVMIVGMSDIRIGSESVNPAKDAGLKIGDILLSIDGTPLTRNNDVAKCVSASQGNEVCVSLLRGDTVMEVYLQPIQTEYDGKYKAGVWVRDSSAGIGTLTYYNPNTMGFAGLGHAICDVDTGKLMPLSSGEIVGVNISGVNAGQSGKPGELRGSFTDGSSMGNLYCNSEMGIFGILDYSSYSAEPVPMAHKQEVEPGAATILSTISGGYPQEFEIVIEKINYMDATATKNMVIHVIDPELLASTGGIVQGMSGSPIMQNGMLVGAVTHVFVNDPTRGYAIFAENMDKQLAIVETTGSVA